MDRAADRRRGHGWLVDSGRSVLDRLTVAVAPATYDSTKLAQTPQSGTDHRQRSRQPRPTGTA
jgi:hypothetical protein